MYLRCIGIFVYNCGQTVRPLFKLMRSGRYALRNVGIDRLDWVATRAGVLHDDREVHHRAVRIPEAHVEKRRVTHRSVVERHGAFDGDNRRTHVSRGTRDSAACKTSVLIHRRCNILVHQIRRHRRHPPQHNESKPGLVTDADRAVLDTCHRPSVREIAFERHPLCNGRDAVELPSIRFVQDFVHVSEGLSLHRHASAHKERERDKKGLHHVHRCLLERPCHTICERSFAALNVALLHQKVKLLLWIATAKVLWQQHCAALV